MLLSVFERKGRHETTNSFDVEQYVTSIIISILLSHLIQITFTPYSFLLKDE